VQVWFGVIKDDDSDARYFKAAVEGVHCYRMPLPAGVGPLDFLDWVTTKLWNLLSVNSRFHCKRPATLAEGPILATSLNLTCSGS
jgi:hypothetical protein